MSVRDANMIGVAAFSRLLMYSSTHTCPSISSSTRFAANSKAGTKDVREAVGKSSRKCAIAD
ncbi:hypothetical protein B4U78_008705 [Microbacterium esteraromaticum]|nr:hypothetical protein B4U78_008705 [Microbacterium esteraromaticum]